MRNWFIILLVIVLGVIIFYLFNYSPKGTVNVDLAKEEGHLSNNVQPTEQLVEDIDVVLVRAQCTGCHSEKLIVQNRATRDGWETMIRWMQQTQNLGDLGENEPAILDYLARNYAPVRKGRREPLAIEWYDLPE